MQNKARVFIISWTCTLALIGASASSAFAQCEYFDHNGSGSIGGNTWVYVLGQYDTAGPMDVDSSGWVDLRDLLAFIPFFGHDCPAAWHDTTSNHIEGLILTEWEVHETELAGITGNLPAGSITYRLYAEMSHEEDIILAVYGDDEAPLNVSSDGTFYGFGSESEFGIVVVDSYNPAFNSVFPANAYSTMLSCGRVPEEDPFVGPGTGYVSGWQFPLQDLDDVGDIVLSDTIGGAWFNHFNFISNQQSGLVFLGQFTIVDGSTLEGTLNLLAETTMEIGHGIEIAEGLSFSSNNLDVLGCTDSDATNYNPAATIQFGPCFFQGDFNQDGETTIEDLLILLQQFGCTECPSGDLNGDGIVGVQDILTFLMLY